jgi:hypothetical protein
MARAAHLDDPPSRDTVWYARWWQRIRRSKYNPHQSTRERTRALRRK